MTILSATLLGVTPVAVEIEIDLSPGLPFFQIVGLPDTILRESKTRVKSAIIQSGFDFPYDQRVVLNLAPSKMKKEGSALELALAVRVLATSGQVQVPVGKNIMFLGELGLDGSVRSVPELEALIYAVRSSEKKIDYLVVPQCVAQSVRNRIKRPVFAIENLCQLNEPDFFESSVSKSNEKSIDKSFDFENTKKNFEDIKWTEFWARHLQIAALGRHHYFVCGPPGCGKTFFAEGLRQLRQIFYEAQSELDSLNALFRRPQGELPWAAPHHSVSTAGLLGGGSVPRPGALTKAHGGLLFLDEMLEFSPTALDAMREPLETGKVEIFRAGYEVSFPSRVQMVAAANPCRCGMYGHPNKSCRCSGAYRQLYVRRLSGPLFDRFDVRMFCKPPLGHERQVSGRVIIEAVANGIKTLKKRGQISWQQVIESNLRQTILQKSGSLRSLEQIKRLSETISALDGDEQIREIHILEALDIQYKLKELEEVGT